MTAWCRKCALGVRHPFAHWHLFCRVCSRPRVFRGPCCRDCLRIAREIGKEVFGS